MQVESRLNIDQYMKIRKIADFHKDDGSADSYMSCNEGIGTVTKNMSTWSFAALFQSRLV
jgi:hypothetical protein